VENYVLEKLAALYPCDESAESGELLNTDLDSLDIASVLSDQELWTSLCESSFQGGNQHSNRSSLQAKSNPAAVDSSSAAPQFQWKYSSLRKEYYASLGLVVMKEQVTNRTIFGSIVLNRQWQELKNTMIDIIFSPGCLRSPLHDI